MKAIKILKWMLDDSINTEGLFTVEIEDTDFDYESFFGYRPVAPAQPGEYMVVYSDCVNVDYLRRLLGDADEQPCCIPTDNDDHKNGGKCVIYLIRMEE